MRFGRESGPRDRLADTQIRISYRGTDWVAEGLAGPPGRAAGDRAPDANGLRHRRVHFPLRLFDILRGPEHVLLVPVDPASPEGERHLERLAAAVLPGLADRVRVVAIAPPARRRPGATTSAASSMPRAATPPPTARRPPIWCGPTGMWAGAARWPTRPASPPTSRAFSPGAAEATGGGRRPPAWSISSASSAC